MRFGHLALLLFLVAGSVWSQSSSRVHLAWDPSPDASVAGYRIYHGLASRQYTNIVDAGAVTNVIVTNLSRGVKMFFAVTAYTTNQLESDFSNEVSTRIGAKPASNLRTK